MNNVEMPERVKKLDQDPRGYPIPYVILIDDKQKSHFIVNDDVKVDRCRRLKLCAICGQPMGYRENGKIKMDMWFIGGPLAAFHERGAYVDTPTHRECGEYALKVCPFLAMPGYVNYKDTQKAIDKVESDSRDVFVDPTMDPIKPEPFVFLKANGFVVKPHVDRLKVIVPTKHLEIEFWKDGEKLDYGDGKEMVEAQGLEVR